jgi:hypothetical protein
MTTATDLNKIMARVQALIAKADATEFPAEAAAFYAKAEELMRTYRLAEEDLIATDASAVMPGMHSIFVASYDTKFLAEYNHMIGTILYHVGCKGVTRWVNRRDAEAMGGAAGLWIDVFGYEGDLRMVDWLWSSARVVFGRHLEPQVDPAVSDQVNAYNLRQAGVLRKDIAIKLWGDNTPALRSKAQRLYVAECRTRGEEPALTGLGTDAKAYADGYADGFVTRLSDRLRASRDAADSVGGALVFAGREDRIKEVMYAHYPNLNPANRTDVKPADNKPVKARKWTQADERRWQRANGAAASSGRRVGHVAASEVEISRTSTPAARVDTTPRTVAGELS